VWFLSIGHFLPPWLPLNITQLIYRLNAGWAKKSGRWRIVCFIGRDWALAREAAIFFSGTGRLPGESR